MKALTLLLLSVLAAASLSGCVTLPDPEASQVFSADLVATVDAAHPVSQTFVARRPRLNGIELWLLAEAPGPAELLVELFHDGGETMPLASAQLAVPAGGVGRPLHVAFAPQPDPAGQSYRLRLRAMAGTIQAWGRAEDAYPGGQAFAAGAPLAADLAFRLSYNYDAGAVLGDLAGLLPRLWLALPLLALLWLPGWLLLDLAGLRPRFDAGEQAALAVGLSLAVTPLLLLWTSTLGLHWSRPAVLAVAVALAALAAWRLARHRSVRTTGYRLQPTTWGLAAIFLVALLVRLAMVRDLAAPAWVDSVHHALLTRLIVDGGALPQTYAPYVDVGTASYHAGFHSVAAAFIGLSGLDVPQALLLLGQVLNALVVPAAYLLAKNLSGNRTVGLVAALAAGLFSPMPAYYASWGRYTQLAGVVMLPAAFVLTRQAFCTRDQSSPSPLGERVGVRGRSALPTLLLAILALAGLVLVHNRIALFYAALLLAYLLGQRYGRGDRWRHLAADGLRLALLAGGALLLTAPWIVPALTSFWLPKLDAWTEADPQIFRDFSWRYLTGARGEYVLVLGAVGWVWALARRRRFALTLGLWVGLLFLLASLGVWGLPGGGFISYLSVEISLFLPLSVLCGYVVAEVLAAWQAALPTRWARVYRVGAGLLLAGAMAFGAWTLLPVLNPDTVLFHQADEAALRWIKANTPPDALFLVNPMPWSAYLHAGADGGAWIAPLAGRRTLPPPVLYGIGAPAEVQAVNELCAQVLRQGNDPEALLPLLRERGVSHVYVGTRGGPLSARALAASESYRPVYSRDGVWVFEVGAGP